LENRFKEYFEGKVILVTGGTGSIGSELVRKILSYPIKQLRIFSRDEYKQFILKQELLSHPNGEVLSFLIGDVRDRDRVFLGMEGVDLVFNAAAMKHVPFCEYNPFEAVKTNVLGTQNLVDAARNQNVEKFIHVSTDKAAMPINVMGATKLLAEKIAVTAEHYKGTKKTLFSAVRFGNVFGSRGSVVPIFHEQIQKGGPVTLTDRGMTRFMMQIPQAVELLLKAALLSKGEELFVLKMPVMRIEDLAHAMIEILAPKYGHKTADIKIELTGRRSGEKIYEILLTEEEAEIIWENDEMLCVSRQPLDGFSPSKIRYYRTDKCDLMDYKNVLDYLKEVL